MLSNSILVGPTVLAKNQLNALQPRYCHERRRKRQGCRAYTRLHVDDGMHNLAALQCQWQVNQCGFFFSLSSWCSHVRREKCKRPCSFCGLALDRWFCRCVSPHQGESLIGLVLILCPPSQQENDNAWFPWQAGHYCPKEDTVPRPGRLQKYILPTNGTNSLLSMHAVERRNHYISVGAADVLKGIDYWSWGACRHKPTVTVRRENPGSGVSRADKGRPVPFSIGFELTIVTTHSTRARPCLSGTTAARAQYFAGQRSTHNDCVYHR